MKILIVYSDPNCSCTRKCTFEFQKGLSEYCATDTLFYTSLEEFHFRYYDIIVFQRLGGNSGVISIPFKAKIKNLIDFYKSKTLTVYFIDDLLHNEHKSIIFFMKEVDLILVPNESYIEHIRIYNKNIKTTKTFIDRESFLNQKDYLNLPKDKIKLLWVSGGMVGSTYMKKLIPELNKSLKNYTLYIIGYNSNLFKKYPNVEVLSTVPFPDLIQYFKSCDIYLNPITVDTPTFKGVSMEKFLECKSELKYLNAGMSKLPIISSKRKPYLGVINNGVNGFILDNDPKLWIKAINQVLGDSILRDRLIKNAYLDIYENYSLRNLGYKVYNYFKDLLKDKKIVIKEEERKDNSKQPNHSPVSKIGISQLMGTQTIGEIFGNKKVYQKFENKLLNISKISILFYTYQRINQGTILITVSEKSIQSINMSPNSNSISKIIDCAKVNDGEWVGIDIPENFSKGYTGEYIIEIKGISCRAGSSLTVGYSHQSEEGSGFFINKTKFNGCLAFRTQHRQ